MHVICLVVDYRWWCRSSCDGQVKSD